jgi:hypothetical protein
MRIRGDGREKERGETKYVYKDRSHGRSGDRFLFLVIT